MSEAVTGATGATGGEAAAAGAAAAAAAGGGAAKPFAESLPEAIRGDGAFASIKDLDGLANGYLGYAKKFGVPPERLLVVPEKPDDAEGFGAIFKALGRPDTADKYALTDPDPAKTGLTVDTAFKGKFCEAAHAAGLSNKQTAALYDWWNQSAIASIGASRTATATAAAEATAALQKEWGQAYASNLGLAEQALQHYGGDDVRAFLTEAKLNNDPRIVRMFAKMGQQLQESGVIKGGAGGEGGGPLSPVQAEQAFNALTTSDEFRQAARLPPNSEARKEMMARRQRLAEIAWPETRP